MKRPIFPQHNCRYTHIIQIRTFDEAEKQSMKQFEIPAYYRSPIISKVKAFRKANDPRKKDFSPTRLDFGRFRFYVARHFGFCYGVENAIEISYRAIEENPGKRIFLLSQMIHNPGVNEDLNAHGIRFIQDTDGRQLISWEEITGEDVVIIPAFGTTREIEHLLREKGVNIATYNTTCPFVEKVWNRSEKLGTENYTIVIHGKARHEETRATFSHSYSNAPTVIVKDLSETRILAQIILGELPAEAFYEHFEGKYSEGFDVQKDLDRIGVINQTTMLATETQAISDYLRETMIRKYGEAAANAHIADTRDTLCYATNDNQSATYGLLDVDADLAIVVGGYNSSNTTHLVELLEQKFKTFFIRDEREINGPDSINTFDIHRKEVSEDQNFLPENKDVIDIILTSGASCPDSVVDRIIQKIVSFDPEARSIEETINALSV